MALKDDVLEGIYNGIYSKDNLPLNLYLELNSKLQSSIHAGFGATISDFNILDKEYELLTGFSQNMQKFSGAKSFHQVKDIEKLVFKGATKVAFDEYRLNADKVFNIYNKTWLEVETDIIIKMTDSSRDWLSYEKQVDTFPLLQFITVGDSRVRPHHAALDGIIKPVNDSFWNSYAPPLEYRCRCLLIQLDEGKITPDKNIDFKEIKKEVDPVFENNPNKSGKLFLETGKNKHPYFKGVTNEQLDNNFGFGLF